MPARTGSRCWSPGAEVATAESGGAATVSVVVPTRDRPQDLARCLGSLALQDPPPLEVIVADDGSRDPRAVTDAVTHCPGARCLRLEGAGPAAARNAGAEAARGDVICFTDDDCEPEPDWAAALGAAATRSGIAAGRTVTPPGAAAPARATQAIIDHLGEWAGRTGSPSPGFAPTCNLGVRTDLLRSHPFDDSFPAAAGEDREWSARLAAAGVKPERVPGAVAVHNIGGGLRTFAQRQFRYGRGSARFRTSAGGRGPLAFYLGLLREGFSRGAGAGVLVAAAQVIGACGAAFEALRRAAAGRRGPRPGSR